jgi:hypothetical protein
MKSFRFAFILLIFSSLVYAIPAASLYQITIPAPSESQDDLQKTLPEALIQVMIKVSGNSKIAQSSFLQAQLPQAASFVESYTYLHTSEGLALQVQFARKAINQLIRQTGDQIWDDQRPLTLIALVAQDPSGPTLLNSQANSPLINVLQQNAERRGLPILLPLMDIQDMQDITQDDVSNLNVDGVLKVAHRYGAKNILEGRIYPVADNQWRGVWLFVSEEKNIQWQIQGNSAEQVIANTFDKLANTLVSRVTKEEHLVSGKQQVLLHITQVNGLQDYADIIKYLRGLGPVANINVINVAPDNIDVEVNIEGGVEALNDVLHSSSKLQLQTNADASQDGRLVYQWNPGIAPGIASNSNQAALSPP